VSTALAAAAATDIPGIRLVGVVIGVLLLFAAIRALFGGGRGRGRPR
jgi:hypothetical protein